MVLFFTLGAGRDRETRILNPGRGTRWRGAVVAAREADGGACDVASVGGGEPAVLAPSLRGVLVLLLSTLLLLRRLLLLPAAEFAI